MQGDSQLYAINRLGTILNTERDDHVYEVLNIVVAGYDTVHEVEMLKERGSGYEPDLVLVSYVLNDGSRCL